MASSTDVTWEDSSTATATTESTTINGHLVTVCLDDEGPLRPAFYWCIDNHVGNDPINGVWMHGWANSVAQARRDAIAQARRVS